MNKHNLQKKLYERMKHSLVMMIALSAAILTGLAATGWANALYILTGVEDTAIVLDGSQEIPDLSSRMVRVTRDRKSVV